MTGEQRAQFPYRAVAGSLRERITSGQISGQLPSRTALAAEYEVADMTITRAIALLKEEGLVYSVPGLGVFTVSQ